ncbi:OmpP1/FadL family transporter [Thiohalophilus sp.]|uniref:OmpP1/FadL family transporter n=1 Tax=Thiohalophilus sp. TaxID=3028392 RepID=UPI002ACEB4D7|nr:outer membrane protein transport protein [Thiohalophilus sp.]MDZ7663304.1 outer membrane protein transport protein [Thiohalophilus sp.]
MNSLTFRWMGITVFGVASLMGASAQANIGMENVGFSARSIGMGGTSIAVGEDTSVMNTNPAALSRVNLGRIDLNAGMMVPDFGFRNGVNSSEGQDKIYMLMSASFAKRINDRITLGIGMFNEGGQGTDYGILNVNSNFLEGGALGCGTACPAEYSSEFGYMVLTPSLAYQVNRELSVGLSAQVGYGMMRMKMPFFMNMNTNPQPDVLQAADMDGNDTNFRAKLGVLYDAGGWGVGAAYTSKADLDLSGDATLVNLDNNSISRMPVEMRLGWPSSFKIGGYMDMRAMNMPLVTFEVQRTNWSEYLDSVPVSMGGMAMAMNTDWEDQTAYRLGLEYGITNDWDARMGFTYGKNPVPDAGILPIMNPIVEKHITMGVGYHGLKNLDFNAAMEFGLDETQTGDMPHNIAPDVMNAEVDMGYWAMMMQVGYTW